MRFFADPVYITHFEKCTVRYIPADHSFTSNAKDVSYTYSLLINDLEMLINDEGAIVDIAGYCPSNNWSVCNLSKVEYFNSSVRVENIGMEENEIKRLGEPYGNDWPIKYDLNTNSIQIGNDPKLENVKFCKVCRNVIIAIKSNTGELCFIRINGVST